MYKRLDDRGTQVQELSQRHLWRELAKNLAQNGVHVSRGGKTTRKKLDRGHFSTVCSHFTNIWRFLQRENYETCPSYKK